MKSAQFSRPVKWSFHKSDISKQSTGTFPLQFSANLRQPGFMKSAFHGVPAQVGRHKAPKCEREHHQRTLFCLARALPSQSMYIIAAMDRRGPPPLRKIVIGSAEQSRCVVHRVGDVNYCTGGKEDHVFVRAIEEERRSRSDRVKCERQYRFPRPTTG